jgi:hypothetical protein
MVKLDDIVEQVALDMVLRSSRRVLPHYIPDNQFSNTNDSLLKKAEKAALEDMEEYGVNIHPDLGDDGQ